MFHSRRSFFQIQQTGTMFHSRKSFFSVSKQGPCFTAIKDVGTTRCSSIVELTQEAQYINVTRQG